MTLKMRSKVKFKVTRRSATYGFLYVHNWLLTSKGNNKRDISHFSRDLEMRSNVKFKVTRRFATYGFLYVHNWFLSCKVDNKRDISYFVPWPWQCAQRSKSRSREHSPHMVSYMSTIESWALKSIIREILAILANDLENEVKGQIQGHENIHHIWFSTCPQLISEL